MIDLLIIRSVCWAVRMAAVRMVAILAVLIGWLHHWFDWAWFSVLWVPVMWALLVLVIIRGILMDMPTLYLMDVSSPFIDVLARVSVWLLKIEIFWNIASSSGNLLCYEVSCLIKTKLSKRINFHFKILVNAGVILNSQPYILYHLLFLPPLHPLIEVLRVQSWH